VSPSPGPSVEAPLVAARCYSVCSFGLVDDTRSRSVEGDASRSSTPSDPPRGSTDAFLQTDSTGSSAVAGAESEPIIALFGKRNDCRCAGVRQSVVCLSEVND